MKRSLFDGRAVLHRGDSRIVLKTLEDASIDAVVTDPPYGLGFMGKAWDSFGSFVERPRGKAAFDHVGGNHNPANSKDAARTRQVENRKFQAWCESWLTEAFRALKPGGHLVAFSGTRTYHRLAVAVEDAGFEIRDQLAWVYGTGFPNVGRFPANLVHDGSDEVLVGFPIGDARGGNQKTRAASQGFGTFEHVGGQPKAVRNDSGSAARFFYCAKASKKDRAGSKHPTVKPVALMRWLVRLVTPPGGAVLEPFAGSGSTLQAAIEEGARVIGVEREDTFFADCCRRLRAKPASDHRRGTVVKARRASRSPTKLSMFDAPAQAAS